MSEPCLDEMREVICFPAGRMIAETSVLSARSIRGRICATACLRLDGLNNSRGINTETHDPACVTTLSLLDPGTLPGKHGGFCWCHAAG